MSFKFTKSNLNFDVYTVASKPTAPGANNDIAIITSFPMPNWIMSPDKPSGTPRSDGDVWIQYSVSGNTFNALKNNSMMIATISAWQYVDGVWADVEAVSYQNGEWVVWVYIIVKDGIIREIGFSTNAYNASYPPTVTYGDGYIEYKVNGGYTASIVADRKIDLSNSKRIELTVDVLEVNTSTSLPSNLRGVSVVVLNSIVNSSMAVLSNAVVRSAQTTITGNSQKLSVDVTDITGEYYVGFVIGGYDTSKGKIRLYDLEVY